MKILSIIIVSYNSKEILTCLQSVYSNTNVPFETIIVDNNSKDDSVKKIKEQFPQPKLLKT